MKYSEEELLKAIFAYRNALNFYRNSWQVKYLFKDKGLDLANAWDYIDTDFRLLKIFKRIENE